MQTYQEFIKNTRPLSLERESDNAFIAYCLRAKIMPDGKLIKRMTMNVGLGLLRQKYILSKLGYDTDLYALEQQIQEVLKKYKRI